MKKPHSPKGIRISDEVHKALRIRAAETGESMGEIAERALRKELGMVTTADRIAEQFEIGDRWELEDGTRLDDVLEAEAESTIEAGSRKPRHEAGACEHVCS